MAKTRVQLELPASAYDRLKRLKDKTEASSYTEVVRKALALQATILAHQDAGSKVMWRDPKTGETTELITL
jgi:hypothetical protein